MFFLYEQLQREIRILRVFGEDDRVELPEEISGYPVTELGAYAFSDKMDRREKETFMARGKICREDGKDAVLPEGTPEISGERIKEVCLPGSLKRIGRYAFYNCQGLYKVEFFEKLFDVGAGAFTGCHHIGRLKLKLEEKETSCLRELLTELPEEIRVDLTVKGERGVFWFPEFFEEGVENTPARILENHVHGSGIRYRNCFQQKSLNIREYDDLFEYAVAWEREELVSELSLGRILHPIGLSEKGRERYLRYLKEHLEKAAALLQKRKEYASLKTLLKETAPSREEAERLVLKAAEEKDTESVSICMDYLHGLGKPKRRVFEL